MLRVLLAGLWGCAVALGAQQGFSHWAARPAAVAAAGEGATPAGEIRRARPLSVPIVREGQIQGYVVAQFAWLAEPGRTAGVDVEPYLLDEAFRAIYADARLDFRNLRKFDLDALRATLAARLRERLGEPILRDVLVHEFNYVSKSDLRQ